MPQLRHDSTLTQDRETARCLPRLRRVDEHTSEELGAGSGPYINEECYKEQRAGKPGKVLHASRAGSAFPVATSNNGENRCLWT